MTDLTKEEQTNVRTALKFLRTQSGTWATLGKALGLKRTTLSHVACGAKGVSASLAFRVAKLAGVTLEEVLTGMYPATGTCPHCGHRSSTFVDEETQVQ